MKQIILIAFIAIVTMVSCNKEDTQLIHAEDYVGKWHDTETFTSDKFYLVISLDNVYYQIPAGQPNIYYNNVLVDDNGVYFTLGTKGGSSWIDYEGQLNLTLDVLTVKIVYVVSNGAVIDPSIYPHLIYKRLNK